MCISQVTITRVLTHPRHPISHNPASLTIGQLKLKLQVGSRSVHIGSATFTESVKPDILFTHILGLWHFSFFP
jgi:hypothetical protein